MTSRAGRGSSAFLSLALPLLAGCAGGPGLPGWTQEPARYVDNGYIVYTGESQEPDPNQAQFAAEGMAIQDLANECSFVPKGARVENHFVAPAKEGGFEAYASVGIDFDACTGAQQAVEPRQIKDLASAPFMEELKRYQDFIGAPPPAAAPAQNAAAPPAVADETDFFFARQYVAYQKQAVILAPPGAYAPGSTETRTYLTNVEVVARPMRAYYARHPRLRTAPTTWSVIEPRVRQRHPEAFKRPMRLARRYRAPRRMWLRRPRPAPARRRYARRWRRRRG